MGILQMSGSVYTLAPEHQLESVYTRDIVGIIDTAANAELQIVSDPAQEAEIDAQLGANAFLAGAPQYVIYNLPAGWSIIGSVLPYPQDMLATWTDAAASVDIFKANNADVYWPEFEFNGIGDFVPGIGYQIKTNEALRFTIPLFGPNLEINTQIDQNRQQRFHERLMAVEIDLADGWNMFGFNRKEPQDAVEAFQNCLINGVQQDITPYVQIVKDGNGTIYYPEWGFNGIGNLIPGHGYQIKMFSSVLDFKFALDTFDDSSLFEYPGIV